MRKQFNGNVRVKSSKKEVLRAANLCVDWNSFDTSGGRRKIKRWSRIIFCMNSELLSVCIPTRNRAKYLDELLSSYAQQVNEAKISGDEVTFYISDNASEDET